MRSKPHAASATPGQPGARPVLPYPERLPETGVGRQGPGQEPIRGVQLHRQKVHADPRGELVSLEQFASLPFAPKRVFFMRIDAPGTMRGGHANSCDELIVPLSGSVLVEVDNGSEHAAIRLTDHDQALWIRAGILIRLKEFEPGTILLVCASAVYGETRHFERPQPGLIKASGPA